MLIFKLNILLATFFNYFRIASQRYSRKHYKSIVILLFFSFSHYWLLFLIMIISMAAEDQFLLFSPLLYFANHLSTIISMSDNSIYLLSKILLFTCV